jgi:predicted O-methyltransferase YrrM
MAEKSFLESKLQDYVAANSVREPDILRRLREETASHPQAIMQIAPTQGQLFDILIRATGAKRVLEVGVFTGYSSLRVALALPEDGNIVACDVSDEYTAVARRYWREAGVAHKIDLRIAPATETLRKLLEEGLESAFDYAFIDADKTNYDNYFEGALRLVRPGGMIVLDNMLQSGRVVDPDAQEDNTVAIRALNRKIAADERVSACLLPIADGVTLAVRR